jgi:hypothetical protein
MISPHHMFANSKCPIKSLFWNAHMTPGANISYLHVAFCNVHWGNDSVGQATGKDSSNDTLAIVREVVGHGASEPGVPGFHLGVSHISLGFILNLSEFTTTFIVDGERKRKSAIFHRRRSSDDFKSLKSVTFSSLETSSYSTPFKSLNHTL